jgi:hypothetical protein
MIKRYWTKLSKIKRTSIILFVICFPLGLLSMGILGACLYYAVSFLGMPDINSFHGDWVWPAMIVAGMSWSFSFLLAAIIHDILQKYLYSKTVLLSIYLLLLWLCDYLIWKTIININT